MINEEQIIAYFESLAVNSRELNHTDQGRESFFYVEDGYDLETFDEALRSAVQSPTMLLVADSGEFADNDSENHTQEIEGQFYILGQKSDDKSIRTIRAECLIIALNILARMKYDARKQQIVPGSIVNFRIDKVPYSKVGPMFIEWYGYEVSFSFICPFGYSATSATWRDIP